MFHTVTDVCSREHNAGYLAGLMNGKSNRRNTGGQIKECTESAVEVVFCPDMQIKKHGAAVIVVILVAVIITVP